MPPPPSADTDPRPHAEEPASPSQSPSTDATSSDPAPLPPQWPAPDGADRPGFRFAARTLLYLLYDGVPSNSLLRDAARVAKALCDLALDEAWPAPARTAMPLSRKVCEFLLAPTLSTVLRLVVLQSDSGTALAENAAHARARRRGRRPWWVVSLLSLHRLARQALIYRLFFRLGSPQYVALSALGIVCCFFHASLFRELVFLSRWPAHFAGEQGISAVIRTALFSAAFALPVQRLPLLARRPANLKKILFTLALAAVQLLSRMRSVLAKPRALRAASAVKIT